MNEKHASIETLQKIKALQRSSRTHGSRINSFFGVLLTTAFYSSLIYSLFTSKNSIAKNYRGYLLKQRNQEVQQNIGKSLDPYISTVESEALAEFLQEINALYEETPYLKISKEFLNILQLLRENYQPKGTTLTEDELWTLWEAELTPELLAGRKAEIKALFVDLTTFKDGESIISAMDLGYLDGMSLSKMVKALNHFLYSADAFIRDRNKQEAVRIGDKLLDKHHNKYIHFVTDLVKIEAQKFSQYILRARYIPELIGLFVAHFLVVRPTLSRINPNGIFSPYLQIPNDEYLTEQKGIELIRGLTSQQRNIARRAKYVSLGAQWTLGGLVLGYFVFDFGSPLYWLVTVNALLLASADYYQLDQLEKERIRNAKKSDQNKTTLSNWLSKLTAFPIKHTYHIEEDPAESYIVLNFFVETKNPAVRQKYKMLNKVFHQLGAHYQIENRSLESHKIVFYLTQSVESIRSLCQITQQCLAELIERETQLSLLFSQIKALDNYLSLSVDLKSNFSPQLEKSYSVNIAIRDNLADKFTLTDRSWIAPDQSLSFEMKGPISDNVFKQWITVLENHSTASFQPISHKSVSSHQPLDAEIKSSAHKIEKKGKERETSLRIEAPITSQPRASIKWQSAELDRTKNANSFFKPREVENAPGHYVVCFFTQKARPKNCPKEAYETLRKMITDRPMFSGETGQGLKRANGHVKNKNGVIVPASRKAKPKGTYRIWRADAYTEIAATGEHLEVYLPENIYIGHS